MGHPAAVARVRILVALVAGLVTGTCGQVPGPSTPTRAEQLDAAFAVARQEPNLTSLVVSQDGVTIRAEYFNGGGADTPQYIWSVTKSVLALAVGAALDRGCLQSLDQNLGELLGSSVVPDPQKAAITLRQLLTMTSGLDFPEMATYAAGATLYNTWVDAPDQVAWILARPLTAAPGQRFQYGTATIHLASVALTRACGTSTASFTEDAVFGPLGIPPREWETDNQGYNNGGSGLVLSPRDMQAIGALVLNGGRIQGRQVISAGWMQAMTETQVATGPGMSTPGYGFAWWTGQISGHDFALANGWGGQFILVVPARRLVVTAAAGARGLPATVVLAQWERIFSLVMDRIVPAF